MFDMLRRTLHLLLVLPLFILVAGAPVVNASDLCTEVYGQGINRFSLATGSPGELGLLKVLGETFGRQENATLCWVKAGSGESLQFLKNKKVDMIMVHAPGMEKKAISEGWGANRILIGSNEFFIVGAPNDPARIAAAGSATDAFLRIANARQKFFSRGDDSGTHKKEMDVWKKAGIMPSGAWYIVTRDFMTATLKRADVEQGYFMTDSSTWVAERKNVRNLIILFRGDKFLVNTYHAISLPAGQSSGAATAEKFIRFVASEEGQQIIRNYGKDVYGEGLYNDAVYAKKYDD
jgi:tungstate transport system substrate-binding protein